MKSPGNIPAGDFTKRHFAFRAALILSIVSFVASLIGILLLFIRSNWEIFGFLLTCITLFIGGIYAVLLSRKGKNIASLSLLVLSAFFGNFTLPLIYKGVSSLTLLALFAVIAAMPLGKMNHETFKRLLVLLGLISIGATFIDKFGVSSRPVVLSPVIESGVTGIIIFVLALIFFRRLSISSLRYKVILSYLIITLFVLLTLGYYSIHSTRVLLIQSGTYSLQTGASQLATEIDLFFSQTKNRILIEAQSKVLSSYLLESSGERSSETDKEIRDNMVNLVNQSESLMIDHGLSTYTKGYLLFDKTGHIVAAAPDDYLSYGFIVPNFLMKVLAFNDLYISPIYFNDFNEPELYFSAQVTGPDEEPLGLLVVLYDAKIIQKVVQESNGLVGEGSSGWVIDDNGLLVAKGISSGEIYQLTSALDENQFNVLAEANRIPRESQIELLKAQNIFYENIEFVQSGQSNNFAVTYSLLGQQRRYIASSVSLKNQPWSVIYAQDEQIFFAPMDAHVRTVRNFIGILVIASVFVSVGISRLITSPILSITRVVHQVANGDLTARTSVRGADEIGKLAQVINSMTEQQQKKFFMLDERVKRRTFELERQSRQLQLAIDIGRTAAKIHDLNDLLTQSAFLISDRFNHYHVGIYLVDSAGEYAVLRASSSEGGKKLLAENHRYAIGQQGIVGYVSATGISKVVSKPGKDEENDFQFDLPHTQSELALPLISSEEILGVLDVHSMKTDVFSDDDIVAMKILAGLIAVAINNALLFAEGQNALDATQRAYGEISHKAWLQRLQQQGEIAFRSQSRSTFRIDTETIEVGSNFPQQISVPIKIRDTVVGFVDTFKQLDKGYWTVEEEETLQKLVDQIGIALESARLYESSQVQAERERLVGEINSRLQGSLDVDTVIKTAAIEIRRVLDLKDVTILLDEEYAASLEFDTNSYE
jgi:GAF domain-containing protein/HAMP domain-containing protein